jgi:translation initiation factor RLI1
MAKPTAVVDYSICDPSKCSVDGVCPAARECPQRTLKQEEPGEPPVQFGMCKGCATCVTTCPLKAIKLL